MPLPSEGGVQLSLLLLVLDATKPLRGGKSRARSWPPWGGRGGRGRHLLVSESLPVSPVLVR